MQSKTRIAALAAVIAAAAVGSAFAAGAEENDALAISSAGIGLGQAVAAAEQQVGGKASRAEYEHTKVGWAYDVEVVSGADVYDVRVDAGTGTVLSSVKDKADHDDGGDHED